MQLNYSRTEKDKVQELFKAVADSGDMVIVSGEIFWDMVLLLGERYRSMFLLRAMIPMGRQIVLHYNFPCSILIDESVGAADLVLTCYQ